MENKLVKKMVEGLGFGVGSLGLGSRASGLGRSGVWGLTCGISHITGLGD